MFFNDSNDLQLLRSTKAIARGYTNIGKQPDLCITTVTPSVNMERLPGTSFVRIEEEPNPLVLEDRRHRPLLRPRLPRQQGRDGLARREAAFDDGQHGAADGQVHAQRLGTRHDGGAAGHAFGDVAQGDQDVGQ